MFDKLVTLAKQLYPTGRAFKMPLSGDFEKLTNAIALSEERLYNDSYSILFAILPDNAGFTVDDATDWELRLGLPDGSLNTLANRKEAIKRKMNTPGVNPGKGHYLNLERELQLAGFSVYVHENIPAVSPIAAGYTSTLTPIQYGQSNYGFPSYGLTYSNKIANKINELEDLHFNLGGTYKSSFFIGGLTLGTIANVPLVRKDEFRQLILKIKQVQSIGFLAINYTP